jgi:hypothetical protein
MARIAKVAKQITVAISILIFVFGSLCLVLYVVVSLLMNQLTNQTINVTHLTSFESAQEWKQIFHDEVPVDVTILHAAWHRKGFPADPSWYFVLGNDASSLSSLNLKTSAACRDNFPDQAKAIEWWLPDDFEETCIIGRFNGNEISAWKSKTQKLTYFYVSNS